MDKFDLADTLMQYGITGSAAQKLKGEISGDDLMNLVSYLKNNGQGVQLNKAAQILGKYGVKLGSVKSMNNYLDAKYESLRSGKALDETFGVMTKIDEAFTYAVEVSDQNRDRVLDWLDENQVCYQATSPTNYRVECGDREVAYRTGRALSEILRKPTVRDSVETEVTEMSKNSKKRERAAREKIADMKPRNPVVAAVKVRSGAGAHDGGKDPRKVDKHGRDAKHKPRFDEEIENDNLNEGVMGAMKPVNPLFRLRELAGLPHIDEDDFEGIEVAEVPPSDPEGPLGAGPVDLAAPADGEELPGDEMVDDLPADDIDGGMMDTGLDGGVDMDDMGGMDDVGVEPDLDGPSDDVAALAHDDIGGIATDPIAPDAGIPGALGSDPVDPVPGMAPAMPTQSDAMAQIEDALNNIQSGLADIRLSEYKSLIQKLQDLTNQAQMMGRDYLGERFERKKK